MSDYDPIPVRVDPTRAVQSRTEWLSVVLAVLPSVLAGRGGKDPAHALQASVTAAAIIADTVVAEADRRYYST